MYRFIRPWLLPMLAVASLTFAAVNIIRNQTETKAGPPPSPPATTPFRQSVSGAGMAEPRTENISVGTNISGIVAQVFIHVGERVSAGQPLFRIDDRQLQGTLKVRQAALVSAEADLKRLESRPRPEELPPSQAKLHQAEAHLAAQKDLLDRATRLLPTHAVSEEEHIASQHSYEAAKCELARLQAEDALLRAGTWEPDKAVARAAVEKARAEVQQTETELERLVVQAPVDGEVLQVNLRPGEYVNTPHIVPPIVLGALDRLHVRVDIDEHDIPRFRPGAPARATLRGNPQREYPLTFVRVEPYVIPKRSLTGDSAERVDTRVLQVIYAFEEGEHSVFVGQQLDVFIDVSASSP